MHMMLICFIQRCGESDLNIQIRLEHAIMSLQIIYNIYTGRKSDAQRKTYGK